MNISFCNFTRNCAEFGGGLVILPEHGKRSSSGNSIVASKCTWSDNYSTLSSAIDIAPKYPDQVVGKLPLFPNTPAMVMKLLSFWT